MANIIDFSFFSNNSENLKQYATEVPAPHSFVYSLKKYGFI